MSKRSSWLIGIGAVAAIALALFAVKALRPGKGATSAAAIAIDGGVPVSTIDSGVDALDVAQPVPPIRQDPASPDRVMPYRPSTYLRYSEGVPAATPADDDSSPIVRRIIDVTGATQEQEQVIRAAWRDHEDGRRQLTALARPPSIGDPHLDPAGLAAIDRDFAEAVDAALKPEQRARLALELPPPPPAPPEPDPEP